MKKLVRIILIVAVCLAALGVAARYFMEWAAKGALESGSKGAREVADAFEATLGRTLARDDVQLEPGEVPAEGILLFYRKNPQALQRDKKYLETWFSAMSIADACNKGEHPLGQWVNTADANWIEPSKRTDAWGHPFCVQSDQQYTVVVSAGPKASTSIDCNTFKISAEELAQMPKGRLNDHANALILVVKKRVVTQPTPGK
jgi:hypothetical protein